MSTGLCSGRWWARASAQKTMAQILADADTHGELGDVSNFERIAHLDEEDGGGVEHQPGATLQRSIGAIDLWMFAVTSLIGSGVFVLTGEVAATAAGPALVISVLIAGTAAALSALCYAEMASMFPVAGSAYSFAYVALGELYAWMIGWDLILEYGLAVAVVAAGWSSYLVALLAESGYAFPAAIAAAPDWAGFATGSYFNLPAFCLVLLMTGMLRHSTCEIKCTFLVSQINVSM